MVTCGAVKGAAEGRRACLLMEHSAFPLGQPSLYAAFFPAFNFAHLARWNAAIFLRAAVDMVCFTGAERVVFAIATTGCDPFLALAHLALCACAILRREAFDIIRVG
jgi:hypothetical protein